MVTNKNISNFYERVRGFYLVIGWIIVQNSIHFLTHFVALELFMSFFSLSILRVYWFLLNDNTFREPNGGESNNISCVDSKLWELFKWNIFGRLWQIASECRLSVTNNKSIENSTILRWNCTKEIKWIWKMKKKNRSINNSKMYEAQIGFGINEFKTKWKYTNSENVCYSSR